MVVILGVIVANASGCESAQERAKRELREEIEAREEAFQASMRLYREGVTAYESGAVRQSRESFRRAVSTHDRNAFAWMHLGVVEYELGNHFEAAHAFEEASWLSPQSYQPHFNLGQVLESVGKYPQAIAAYKKALELAPNEVEVMENLARCYIARGENLEEARSLIDRALTLEYRPEWRLWLEEQRSRLSADGKKSEKSFDEDE